MKFQRFLKGVKDEKLWRDLEIEVKNEGNEYSAEAKYLPKENCSQGVFPEKKQIDIERTQERLILRSTAQSEIESLRKIYAYLEDMEYPDRHVTRKAGAMITIRKGKIVEMESPKIEYCPLTNKVYDGCDKCDIRRGIEGKIDDGMFTPNRKVCELEDHIPYGTSEMLKDAVQGGKLDCAVLVCEGAGTVITNRSAHIQGIGEKMTGLYYTSPIDEVIENLEEGSHVLYPFTARIDQVGGVKTAFELGYEKVAVTFATHRNDRMRELEDLEEKLVKIGLCTTGIDRGTAKIIRDCADLAWGCASKHIREVAGPEAKLQLGTKIPVYALTQKGIDIAKTRLEMLRNNTLELEGGKKYLFTCHEGLQEVDELPVRSDKEPRPLL